MEYGKMNAALNRQPVEVGIFVDGQRQSGPFVANRERRGLVISDSQHTIGLTADEALELLEWLRNEEEQLRAMVTEEVEAVALVERRLNAVDQLASNQA